MLSMCRYLLSFVVTLMLLASGPTHAAEGFIKIDTGRGESYQPVYEMTRPDATATLIILPGGNSGTGKATDGKPTSKNTLVRLRDYFYEQKFNVLIVFRPSDMDVMEYNYRVSSTHMKELENVVDYAAQNYKKPVWVIGMSRGSVSGTAVAIALGDKKVQGLVLTSSITNTKQGAISTQNIEDLKIPVLVVHHEQDACNYCSPSQAQKIPEYLKSSPYKRAYIVNGGSDPVGDVCDTYHWHGFINSELETAKLISDWIKNPTNE